MPMRQSNWESNQISPKKIGGSKNVQRKNILEKTTYSNLSLKQNKKEKTIHKVGPYTSYKWSYNPYK